MGSGKILVMDDEELIRKMLEKLLKRIGYEPEFAKDGAEAIEMYQKARKSGTPYNMVILDLIVPGGMGGKDTLSRLLELDQDIKAIVTSGYSEDPVLANYRDYGFKGRLPKPFDPHYLSSLLHRVLSDGNK